MTVLHFWCHGIDWLLLFWGLLYLLIWTLHLWYLAAHEPLLSSMAVCTCGDGLGDCHIINAVFDVSSHSFRVLLQVCMVIISGRLFKHVPVCVLEAVFMEDCFMEPFRQKSYSMSSWSTFIFKSVSTCFISSFQKTPASVHSLWSSPKCLNRLCLTVFSSLRSSLLLVHIFLPNFFLPVNFAFNMLWYSTPWTAPPFSNDPLWLTLFVEGVNDHLLDHCQVSSVPHYCVSKNKRYPGCILYGWSFIETQI